jgi:hypothetical protein
MEVLEVGTKVLIDNDIPATITCISVRGVEHYLSYEVTWWDERSRKEAWVTPQEVKSVDETKHRSLEFISQGFKKVS